MERIRFHAEFLDAFRGAVHRFEIVKIEMLRHGTDFDHAEAAFPDQR
jgi:hypothetical protein